MKHLTRLFFVAMAGLLACSSPNEKQKADTLYVNGTVYTVDSAFAITEAFAVKDGQFIATGKTADLRKQFDATQEVDLKGQFVYPGLYDAHCHFLGYGLSLNQVDLTGTTSFDDVISRVVAFAKKNPELPWITGRGWDQNDWEVKEFPSNDTLNQLFPNLPVAIRRIDGHGLLANAKALELSGYDFEVDVEGGDIIRQNGIPTGVLMDNAAEIVLTAIPEPTDEEKWLALQKAQKECFAVGLTSVHDAGLPLHDILLIDSMQKAGELRMQIYAMLEPSAKGFSFAKKGPYRTDLLHVQSFKVYADGALGSRGACLKEPYHDRPGHYGMMVYAHDSLRAIAKQIYDLGFQMNTHCIGDSANKTLLDIYGTHLEKGNDRRWRIEHAQVLDQNDFSLFKQFSVLPSVQPTHCTSDMYWATDRVGQDRIQYAYAYQTLLQQNGLVAAGSDFPIESINPLYGFYAAITRQDHEGYPEGGFHPDELLTREQALKAMTIWAAYAGFEEKYKGSIEKGKQADFVVTDTDLMTATPSKLIKPVITQTTVKGRVVFSK